jgi:hypothetical protein
MDLEPGLLRLAASLGFNDLTLQTEKSMAGRMESLRDHAAQHGYIKLAKSLGMSPSVWVREFQDWDAGLGPKTLDSDRFWNAVAGRYRRIFDTILLEINYLVLTVVESEVRVTKDAAILARLIGTINGECRRAGKKLIFRAFAWYPEELKVVAEAIEKIPIDGALDFIERNRHHIRSQLYPSSAMSGLTADLAQELRRFVPPGAMSQQDRMLVSSIIIAAGAEAVFHVGRKSRTNMKYLREFLAKFLMNGLSGWQSADAGK